MDKKILSDSGKKIYNKVKRQMRALNIYNSIDEDLIIMYAFNIQCYELVTEEIGTSFLTTGAKGNDVKNPLLTQQKAYLEQAHKLATALRITPQERAKALKALPPKTGKIDPLQNVLKAVK